MMRVQVLTVLMMFAAGNAAVQRDVVTHEAETQDIEFVMHEANAEDQEQHAEAQGDVSLTHDESMKRAEVKELFHAKQAAQKASHAAKLEAFVTKRAAQVASHDAKIEATTIAKLTKQGMDVMKATAIAKRATALAPRARRNATKNKATPRASHDANPQVAEAQRAEAQHTEAQDAQAQDAQAQDAEAQDAVSVTNDEAEDRAKVITLFRSKQAAQIASHDANVEAATIAKLTKQGMDAMKATSIAKRATALAARARRNKQAQSAEAQSAEAQHTEAQDAQAQVAEAQDVVSVTNDEAEAQDAEAQDVVSVTNDEAEADDVVSVAEDVVSVTNDEAEAQDAEAQDVASVTNDEAEAQDAEAQDVVSVTNDEAEAEDVVSVAEDVVSVAEDVVSVTDEAETQDVVSVTDEAEAQDVVALTNDGADDRAEKIRLFRAKQAAQIASHDAKVEAATIAKLTKQGMDVTRATAIAKRATALAPRARRIATKNETKPTAKKQPTGNGHSKIDNLDVLTKEPKSADSDLVITDAALQLKNAIEEKQRQRRAKAAELFAVWETVAASDDAATKRKAFLAQ